MATALPRKSPRTVGLVTHPRRNRDEVFTAIASWIRARGVRLIALPEEAPAMISHADHRSREAFARTAGLVGRFALVVPG
jgi:hypothetical protein